MKEQKISVDTCVLANEKGYPMGSITHLTDDMSSIKYVEFTYVPTQALLQKWLREIHEINIFMTFKPNIKKWDFIPYDMGMNGNEYVKYNLEYTKQFNDRRFDTYEEALEIGLQEGLKLIKEKE